jgi:hypothetical protein
MKSHGDWLFGLALKAKTDQKSFRIVNLASGKEDVDAIDISVLQNQAEESASDKVGWVVDIRYTNAPLSPLFLHIYPSESQARKVFEDFSMFCGEIEGLIRSEKFEEAKTKTEELVRKFKANTAQPPVSENPGDKTPPQ